MMWLFGIGAVLAFEGLALALMPGRLEDALALMERLPLSTRRGLGLGALALGVVLIWLARRIGA